MTYDYLLLLSRLILGLYFIFNFLNHLKNLKILSQYAESKKVPYPKLSVVLSGLLLLIGGVSILLGIYIEIGVLALTLFFLPVSFMIHNFWTVQDPQQKMIEIINFMKNMAIWAGVIALLFIPKPWPFSLNF
jgi:uncharacterized membrane protein YphA (DoxX/SURF4 family)